MKYDLTGFDPDDPCVIEAVRYLDESEADARRIGALTADYLVLGDGLWTVEDRAEIVEDMKEHLRERYAALVHEPIAQEPLFVDRQLALARQALVDRYAALKVASGCASSSEGGH